MNKCSKCLEWGVRPDGHVHIEEVIEGLLEDVDISRNAHTKQAEEIYLEDGLILYRYLQWPNDLSLIASSQQLASKSLCLCADCMVYSLSFVPHYGDGAYCTTNEQLKTEWPRVYHTHGIDIREMNYRVIIKIIDASKFQKIKKTAGVVRSVPLGQELFVNEVVFTDKGAVKVITFQEWNGDSWVDVLLEELEGVS